jgi:glycosyltransferase involved in cell wall biosynthesis
MNRPLKIGIFTRPIDQGTSGSGFHLLEILNHLFDQDDENEYVLVHHERNDRPIYRRRRELIVPRNPLKAARILRSERFDILHYNPLTIIAPLWGSGARRLATIHGASILFLPDQFGLFKRLHAKLLLPFLARRMDRVVTVSRTSAAFMRERYGVDSRRIRICFNATNDEYRPSDAVSARSGDIAAGATILHISKFSERKNPWTLLEAFARVAAALRDAGLVVVGSGWKNPAVEAWLASRSLADRVSFAGFVDEAEKIRLLQTSALFVFPSLYEGFGMPNLEAMACGCPVVTTRVFAIPEIVGDAAMIVDDPRDAAALAEKMLEVLGDRDLRKRLVEAGIARARDFSWDESAAVLKKTYGEMME